MSKLESLLIISALIVAVFLFFGWLFFDEKCRHEYVINGYICQYLNDGSGMNCKNNSNGEFVKFIHRPTNIIEKEVCK